MPVDLLNIFILVIAGFASGLFISICSGTAAGYMIPILTVFLGKSIHNSIGSSLFIDSIVGLSAGVIYLRKGKTKIKIVLPLIVSTSIGAFVGSFFTSAAPERGLNIYIAVALILFGVGLIYNGFQKNVNFVKSKYAFSFFKKHKFFLLVFAGLIIGLMSGFTGFGGAGFISIGLIFIFDLDLHTSIGTSLIVMFFLAGFGSLGHIVLNEFVWDAVLISAPAAIFGSVFGSLFANRINEDVLARSIGFIMLILGFAIFIHLAL